MLETWCCATWKVKRVEDNGVGNEHSGCWRQRHVSQVTNGGRKQKSTKQPWRWTDNGREYAGCRSAGETQREGEKNFGGSQKIGYLPRGRNRVKECRRGRNNRHAETEEQ